MSYRALYRVWRPQVFTDLVGQEHVTRTLMNALQSGQFAHAYLFSGPRGTGKTSAAKIMAKAVNCVQGPTAEPCNQCEPCRKVVDGSLMDVVEIDAASNRGVDEIRDLRDKVKYAPTEVRRKVYIIDEVHMLTTEAFNALLKTLEEPPQHVLFILATTEPHKLPPTIISRCQRFSFRRVPFSKIVARLRHIVDSMGSEVTGDALAAIARSADGGMRDALSLLDQVLAFAGERVEVADVHAVTGSVSENELSEILEALLDGAPAEALDSIERLVTGGLEPERLIHELVHAARDVLLLLTAPKLAEVKERLAGREGLTKLADRAKADQLARMMDGLIEYQQQMKWTAHPRILLELAMVQLCQHPEAMQSEESSAALRQLQQKVHHLERQVEMLTSRLASSSSMHLAESAPAQGKPSATRSSPTATTSKGTGIVGHLHQVLKEATPKHLQTIQREWDGVLNRVKEQKITVHAWLVDGEPVAATEHAVILAFKNTIHRETTEKEANKRLIEHVMGEIFGSSKTLFTVMRADWEAMQRKATSPQSEPVKAEKAEADIVEEAVQFFGEELIEVTD